jgi:fluoride exporter
MAPTNTKEPLCPSRLALPSAALLEQQLARRWVGCSRSSNTTAGFPWSTFTINLSGCFLIGIVSAALVDRHHLPAWLRVGLVVGVIGGYTTFSAFIQEVLDLHDTRHLVVSLAYVLSSLGLGLVALVGGTKIGSGSRSPAPLRPAGGRSRRALAVERRSRPLTAVRRRCACT